MHTLFMYFIYSSNIYSLFISVSINEQQNTNDNATERDERETAMNLIKYISWDWTDVNTLQ
jgi:hypothetical protein